MGQNESSVNTHLSAPKPRRAHNHHEIQTSFKTLKILTNNQPLLIEIKDTSMTCGWLLSEVIRAYKGDSLIMALRTKESVDILDEWLLRFEKSLKPFKAYDSLLAYFAESCEESNIHRFNVLKTIGIGKQSKVVLARKKDTGFLYAIKVVEKSEAHENNRINQVLSERSILSITFHPFIIKLHWAFQSNSQFFFVLGFCPGGELKFHLKNIGRFTENQAKFYFGEVLLALEYLHSLNIIYSNLKPENIMLDIDGHIKLVDFNLAYTDSSESWAFFTFGQPSSTINNDLIVAKAGDFYGLGVLLYELLTQEKIAEGFFICPDKAEDFFPRFLSKDVKSLLIKLLNKDPHSRLGSRGVEEIKQHPWCQGLNWEKLLTKRIVPPFRPNLKTSNFSPDVLRIPVNIESAEGDHVRDFDYFSESIEKSYFSMGEMIDSDSNVPSERASTDAGDTFNSLNARSHEILTSQISSYESTLSFSLQTQHEDVDKSQLVKSLSPEGRAQMNSTINESITGIQTLFTEDEREWKNAAVLSLHIPNFSQDMSKMKECVRRKINSMG